MEKIGKEIFKKLYKPPKDSHKGQNGKLTIIGGSKLFHGASLWALKVASRIVDMVFYSTVPENEELTKKLKSEIYDFIFVPRDEVEDYIKESDAVLIGPGLTRDDKLSSKLKPSSRAFGPSIRPELMPRGSCRGAQVEGDQSSKPQLKTQKLNEKEWEENTFKITQHLLARFPNKKWIIDAGSLQMMEAEWLKKMTNVVITPHLKEFCQLFKLKIQNAKIKMTIQNSKFKKSAIHQLADQQLAINNLVPQKAQEYGCTIVLKGQIDIVCCPGQCAYNTTGNEGMTKGGTGDVLAGLIAALACKNDLFLASCAGVFINGLAGDELYKKVGPYFNASDLCDQIPKTMKELLK